MWTDVCTNGRKTGSLYHAMPEAVATKIPKQSKRLAAFRTPKFTQKYRLEWLNLSSLPFAVVAYLISFYEIRSEIQGKITGP